MLSLAEFKKSLGLTAQDMTDEKIEQFRKLQDQLADTIFDIWLENKNNKPKQNLEIK
jgi:hypothetical protein